MSINYKLIGNRIKQKRNAVGLTQEKMSELLQVSVGYVSQIERGITKPNLEMLSNISELLCCDISDFVSNVTTEKNSFLNHELNELFQNMTSPQKLILLEIAQIIKNKELK